VLYQFGYLKSVAIRTAESRSAVYYDVTKRRELKLNAVAINNLNTCVLFKNLNSN
jgi:hypothetical protein